jgi:hypothetical protein
MQAKASIADTTSITQYVCSHCQTILRETTNISETDIARIAIKEDCPTCGSSLSQTVSSIKLKTRGGKLLNETSPVAPPVTFSLASDYYSNHRGLTFGIAEIDMQFSLRVGEGICIHSTSAGMLIERLCVRALMPSRSGGLGSRQVVFIDGGNSSDLYKFVEYCRLFGLDYRDALQRIVQSRAFTIYQLVDLITHHLASVVEKSQARAVFIADPFEMFEREPNLDEDEGRRLASKMATALRKILLPSPRQQQQLLIVISLSRNSRYDNSFKWLGKHLFVEILDKPSGSATPLLQDKYSKLTVRIDGLV